MSPLPLAASGANDANTNAVANADNNGGSLQSKQQASASVTTAGDLLPPLPPSVAQDRAPLVPRPPGGDSDDGDNDDPDFFVALTTPSTTMPL